MPEVTITDPVGAEEIAERLEVTTATVHSWRHRAMSGNQPRAVPLPEPDIIVTKTPIWSWATIRLWARTTGRLKS